MRGERMRRNRARAFQLKRPRGSPAMRRSGATRGGYSFIRVPAGSNNEPATAATVTGKSSFM